MNGDVPSRIVIGLMSGTSIDGIDAACCRVGRSGPDARVELLHFTCLPYPAELRRSLLEACHGRALSMVEVGRLHFALGHRMAEAALEAIAGAGQVAEEVDLIGSHGQTVAHAPVPTGGPGENATLQLGSGPVIAQVTGVTTVSDFRSADMAVGGTGAPLAPYGHFLLFRHAEKHRIVQNIGGIGNCTFLPAGGDLEETVAFDTGPGNVLLDGLMEEMTGGVAPFDAEGKAALAGRVREEIVARQLEHPYFSRRPPKATGREEFGRTYVLEFLRQCRRANLTDADVLATAADLVARTMVQSYGLFPKGGGPEPEEVILCGGGSRNEALVQRLRKHLPTMQVFRSDALGYPVEALEAMIFALLAYETYRGRPANLPRVTGASRRVVLGSICPGGNFSSLFPTGSGPASRFEEKPWNWT